MLQFSKPARLHTKHRGLEQPRATALPAWIRGLLILSCLTSSQTEYAEKLLKVIVACFSITIHRLNDFLMLVDGEERAG